MEFLIEFQSGGQSFGAAARTIHGIAGARWQPAESDCASPLYELLVLDRHPWTRTLLLETTWGLCGLRVDAISKRLVTPREVLSVPSLLQSWLNPRVIAGLTVDSESGQILAVLDLPHLAALCAKRARANAGESELP